MPERMLHLKVKIGPYHFCHKTLIVVVAPKLFCSWHCVGYTGLTSAQETKVRSLRWTHGGVRVHEGTYEAMHMTDENIVQHEKRELNIYFHRRMLGRSLGGDIILD